MSIPALERTHLEAALCRVRQSESERARVQGDLDTLRASYQQQSKIVSSQRTEITELRASAEKLTTQVCELTELLRRGGVVKTSKNSSTPPSADPIAARTGRAYVQRRKKQEKPGRQKGAPGVTVELREADETVTVEREECTNCEASLLDAPITATEVRQVVDLHVQTVVTNYEGQTRKCTGCGCTNAPAFPREARARLCYGPGIRAAALEFSAHAQVPLRVSAGLVSSVLGTTITHRLIDTWVTDAAKTLRLKGFEQGLIAALRSARVIHADETPISLHGKVHQVHVQANDQMTYLFPGNRSKDAIIAGGVLKDFTGLLVSDDYGVYKTILAPEATRQQCWAHLLRRTQFFDQAFTPSADALAKGHTHPHPELARMVTEIQALIHQSKVSAETGGTPPSPARFRELASLALTRVAAPLGKTEHDLKNLLLTFTLRDGELWHFLDGSAPATNNLAEQALRPQKVRARRSGAYRGDQALRDRLLLASYLDTLRKQEISRSRGLRDLIGGTPSYVPG